MSTSYSRGHKIYYDFKTKVWKYCDTNEIINDEHPCKRCGNQPTKEGYDFCLGYIEGATSACCGHGTSNPILILDNDNTHHY